MKNPRFSYIIRSLCGLYLFWIVWDLLKAFRSGEEVSVLMIVAAVAFVIFGALFLVTGVRGWMRVNKELQEEAEKMKEEEEKAEKELKLTTKKTGMSLSDRANLVKKLEETKTDEDTEPEE
ncbi:hypothetical protein [Blautia hydrogenotrophica]|uniref:hypothetical protein n=1 Tax=Blautia hydrogenotrophica TaxID=53443 RepID=UPI002E7881F7|nr:hypothetical protein [Blautia hydrogenotrophica]MEE0463298.1 hypothetical protein [Blautia hydrogenotrophica]